MFDDESASRCIDCDSRAHRTCETGQQPKTWYTTITPGAEVQPDDVLIVDAKLSLKDLHNIRGAFARAYQRGREDAAKAIEEGNSCYTTNHATGWDLFCREHAIAAARGDGA